MNEPSIFTKIINGEIPCHKVYEDERTFAFMDIHPVQDGHVLVVPKVQVDKLYELPDEDYVALMQAAKAIAQRMQTVLNPPRIAWAVVGFDVPHAHIHLVPSSHGFSDLDPKLAAKESDHEKLAKIAEKIRF